MLKLIHAIYSSRALLPIGASVHNIETKCMLFILLCLCHNQKVLKLCTGVQTGKELGG